MSRSFAAIAACAVLATGLVACAASTSGRVVARVGDVSITEAALKHWMSVMAVKGVGPAASPRARALDFLISSEWQIGEAAEQGLGVTAREVEQRFEQRVNAYRDGASEFHEVLRVTGETESDVKREIKAELAAARLGRLAMGNDVRVTPTQVTRYYRDNKREFTTAPRREAEVISTKSVVAARRIVRDGAGRRLSSVTQPESLVYDERLKGGTATPLRASIFAARPNMVAGPVDVRGNYFVFEVTRVMPGELRTLAQVKGSIEATLRLRARRRHIAEDVRAWRAKWVARTDCQPGFVVPKCSQYAAANGSSAENPQAFN
ncbi:MAG TPA: peptidyl-prolyl cis-trans isomerase [Solirubrobacteraceae bacterium]|jgi:hypothetical protein|nr:peptidyl-prolyl cis-trans isomerase [Solirubrobacteraceae bacterium]